MNELLTVNSYLSDKVGIEAAKWVLNNPSDRASYNLRIRKLLKHSERSLGFTLFNAYLLRRGPAGKGVSQAQADAARDFLDAYLSRRAAWRIVKVLDSHSDEYQELKPNERDRALAWLRDPASRMKMYFPRALVSAAVGEPRAGDYDHLFDLIVELVPKEGVDHLIAFVFTAKKNFARNVAAERLKTPQFAHLALAQEDNIAQYPYGAELLEEIRAAAGNGEDAPVEGDGLVVPVTSEERPQFRFARDAQKLAVKVTEPEPFAFESPRFRDASSLDHVRRIVAAQTQSSQRVDALVDEEAAWDLAAAFKEMYATHPEIGDPVSGLHVIIASRSGDGVGLPEIYGKLNVTHVAVGDGMVDVALLEEKLEIELGMRLVIDLLVVKFRETLKRYRWPSTIKTTVLEELRGLKDLVNPRLWRDPTYLPQLLYALRQRIEAA